MAHEPLIASQPRSHPQEASQRGAAEGRLPFEMAMRLFGYDAVRLLVAHRPWSVNLVDFQQHLVFSLRPHITVPILASQKAANIRKQQ